MSPEERDKLFASLHIHRYRAERSCFMHEPSLPWSYKLLPDNCDDSSIVTIDYEQECSDEAAYMLS